MLELITFIWERWRVSKDEIIEQFSEYAYRTHITKNEGTMFHSHYEPQKEYEEAAEFNKMIDEKIKNGEWDIEKLLSMKKQVYYTKWIELHNHFIKRMRGVFNNYAKEIEQNYSLEFLATNRVDIKIGNTLFNYNPEDWFTAWGEYVYWWEKLKEYVRDRIRDYKERMRFYHRKDEEWECVNIKINLDKISEDWTQTLLDFIETEDWFVSLRRSAK